MMKDLIIFSKFLRNIQQKFQVQVFYFGTVSGMYIYTYYPSNLILLHPSRLSTRLANMYCDKLLTAYMSI